MPHQTSNRRCLPVFIAALVLTVAACSAPAPDAPTDSGAVAEIGDVVPGVAPPQLEQHLTIPMPDQDYVVTTLAAIEPSDSVRVPDGASMVGLGLSTAHRPDAPGDGDGETTVAIRSDGVDTSLDLDQVTEAGVGVVVPGDGSDAELVLEYDGHEVVHAVADGALVSGTPFAATLYSAFSDYAAVPLPADWTYRTQPYPGATVRLTNYRAEEGWAPPGEMWVDGHVYVEDPVVAPDDSGDTDTVRLPATVTTARVVIDGVATDLDLTSVPEGGPGGGTSEAILGAVPADTDEFHIEIDYTIDADAAQTGLEESATYVGPMVQVTYL